MNEDNYTHVIDWDQVNTIEDVKIILKGIADIYEVEFDYERTSKQLQRYLKHK